MKPMDFAQMRLHPFTVKGVEIVPDHCPYCHGGKKRDKYTFALNTETGAFNCKRGTCGKQGTFRQLLQDFGEMEAPAKKQYKLPDPKRVKPLASQAEQYLLLRKISKVTQSAYRIASDADGNIVFPFLNENGVHTFTKYRPAKKVQPGDRKAWREAETMPILFGMHLCQKDKPLIIHEGEIDAMSSHEAGLQNCVSVPSGAEDLAWLDTCWDFLQGFEQIYLFGDNDAPGRKMVAEVSRRLSDKEVYIVKHHRKDANEMLFLDGPQSLLDAYNGAKIVPPYGIIKLADAAQVDIASIPKTKSGIAPLDKAIGGFLNGELSVWTAKRGEGKSTLLSQICLEAIDSGVNVCAYSGEMTAWQFQYWANLQAAGPEYVEEYTDQSTERLARYVPGTVRQQVVEWYRERFYLYDNSIAEGNEAKSILKAFELAARRYNCKVFLVDNLMTAEFATLNDSNYYRAQSNFVGQLMEFAKRMDVHVHLVAHPRKTSKDLDGDELSGSGDIANRASNVFSLKRIDKERVDYDMLLCVVKNRMFGAKNKIGLNFCGKSRRYYVPSAGNVRKYGWNNAALPEFYEIEYGDDPFGGS